MCLIKKIKKMFNKSIEVKESRASEIVIPCKFKGGVLKLGKIVNVQNNFIFALGHDGKVLDTLSEGTHTLSALYLPKCLKKYKLDKPDKSNSLKTSFKVEGYYISMIEQTIDWKTFRKMLFLENNKKFNASANGKVVFTVNNPTLYLSCLLSEYSYLKDKEAVYLTQDWLSEYLTTEIEKKNFSCEELNDKQYIIEQIFSSLKDKFLKYGLDITSLEIENVVLPKSKVTNKKYVEPAELKMPILDTDEIDYSQSQWGGFEQVNDSIQRKNIDNNKNQVYPNSKKCPFCGNPCEDNVCLKCGKII